MKWENFESVRKGLSAIYGYLLRARDEGKVSFHIKSYFFSESIGHFYCLDELLLGLTFQNYRRVISTGQLRRA
jgi:hypothetical protein